MHILQYHIYGELVIGSYRHKIYNTRKLIAVKISIDDSRICKQYVFRGRLQFIVPVDRLYNYDAIIMYMSIPKIGNINLEIADLLRNKDIIICNYGQRQCYDPRMFGKCITYSSVYRTHEIDKFDDDVCVCCRKPFPGLILPIICGRLIWHLPT